MVNSDNFLELKCKNLFILSELGYWSLNLLRLEFKHHLLPFNTFIGQGHLK